MKKFLVALSLVSLVSFLLGFDKEDIKDYPNSDLVVTADWVEEREGKGNIYIIDVREKGYEQEHIPSAVYFSIEELVDKEHPVEGYLVSKQTFEQKMNQLGIKDQDTVVVYDEGDDTRATRLFYALEYYGHQNVRLLNGGYKAWQANEGKISKDIHSPKRGNFTARENDRLMVTKDEVKNVIGEKDIVIFDVRSPEEYKGEKILAKRGGHIPSAVNLEWNRVLEKEIPIYKPAEEIDLLLKKAGVTRDKRVVVYCHKAMRASHMYVTLRLMGFENLTVYEGSWIEWGNDPHTPVTNPS